MKREQKTTPSSDMFDSLVRNAMEFLERSVAELKNNPKYAVIDFCTAIELFLKARLLQEHWVLIYEDPKRANLIKFRRGDFTSVGMNSAIERLREVVDLRISRGAAEVFNEIRQHRNKLVHFFHPAYTGELAGTAVEDVAVEQCKGWFHLYPLLQEWCISGFAGHFLDLITLNSRMLENRPLLQIRLDALSDDIARAKATGVAFSICAVCGFEASTTEVEVDCTNTTWGGKVSSAKCVVCEIDLKWIDIPCPFCIHTTPFYAAPMKSRCHACSRPISIEDMLKHTSGAVCGNHECYTESVAQLGDEFWVCFSCLAIEEGVWQCEECGWLIAGECEVPPLCLRCSEMSFEEEVHFPPASGGVM